MSAPKELQSPSRDTGKCRDKRNLGTAKIYPGDKSGGVKRDLYSFDNVDIEDQMKDYLLIAIGAMISIPISLLVNLVTPRSQALLAHLSTRYRAKNERRQARERRLIVLLARTAEARTEVLAHMRFSILIDLIFYAAGLTIVVSAISSTEGNAPWLAALLALITFPPVLAGVRLSVRYNRIRRRIFKTNRWPDPSGHMWSSDGSTYTDLADDRDLNLPMQDLNAAGARLDESARSDS